MIKTSKGGKNVNRKFYYSKGFTVRDNFVTTLVEITVVTPSAGVDCTRAGTSIALKVKDCGVLCLRLGPN